MKLFAAIAMAALLSGPAPSAKPRVVSLNETAGEVEVQ